MIADGAGEGAAHMPLENRMPQLGGHGWNAGADKRTAPSRAVVNPGGNRRLPRAGGAEQQDGHGRGGEPLDQAQGGTPAFGGANREVSGLGDHRSICMSA